MIILLDYYIFFVRRVLIIIGVLISVAFFTLFERHILAIFQFRTGPAKNGPFGIFQPFCDAIKLFTKEQVFIINSNILIFIFSPIFSLFISLIV